jgi:hypothetical protein
VMFLSSENRSPRAWSQSPNAATWAIIVCADVGGSTSSFYLDSLAEDYLDSWRRRMDFRDPWARALAPATKAPRGAFVALERPKSPRFRRGAPWACLLLPCGGRPRRKVRICVEPRKQSSRSVVEMDVEAMTDQPKLEDVLQLLQILRQSRLADAQGSGRLGETAASRASSPRSSESRRR